MFGSTLLDVALGIVSVFLLLSLIASAVTEAVSALLSLRHRTLRAGVQAMLNDPDFTGLARELYNHALVSPLGTGVADRIGQLTHPPAYIDPHQFGTALIDVLQSHAASPSSAEMIAAITNPQLKQTIQALDARATRLGTHLADEIAGWFDNAMDRVGGWYKRRAQWISFLVALVLAAILNADAIHVAAALWDRPVVAAHVGSAAVTIPALLTELQANSLVGWPNPGVLHGAVAWALAFAGWAISAVATLFGAAFWFDLLQNVVQVRATGTTPDEKLDATAARR